MKFGEAAIIAGCLITGCFFFYLAFTAPREAVGYCVFLGIFSIALTPVLVSIAYEDDSDRRFRNRRRIRRRDSRGHGGPTGGGDGTAHSRDAGHKTDGDYDSDVDYDID